MINLLKTDFKRFTKDKTILIGLVLVVAFSFISVIFTFGLSKWSELDSSIIQLSGVGLMANSFSMTNNMGLVLPILLAIVVVKDFTHGTVRNKLVSGFPRYKIYLSALITSMVFGLLGILLYSLLHLMFGSMFFGFGTGLSSETIGIAFKALALSVFIYSVLISIALFFSFITKSIGLSIVLTLVFTICIALWGSMDSFPGLPDWLKFITSLSPSRMINNSFEGMFGAGDILKAILCTIFYNGLFTGVGIYLFYKIDVK